MSNDNQDELMLDDDLLDDLADLPQVQPYPAGAHMAKMVITKKEGKKDKDTQKVGPPSYTAAFEYISVMELTDPAKTAPNAGDKAFVSIYTKKKDGTANEFGQGQLKLLLAPLAERLQTQRIPELLEATKAGVEVAIVTGIKKGQEGYSDQMTVVKCMLA